MKAITLARKPLVGTVAKNVIGYGCGGLNIDASRIILEPNSRLTKGGSYSGNRTGSNTPSMFNGGNGKVEYTPPPGRFPANLILSQCSVTQIDNQSGERPSWGVTHQPKRSGYGYRSEKDGGTNVYREPDTGGASRFFKKVSP